MLTFTVEGRPCAYVRMTQRSKWSVRAQRYLTYRGEVTARAKEAGAARWSEPVRVYIQAYVMKRTFDLDNLVKCVLDGLNGVAYEDDRQVALLSAGIATGHSEESLAVTVTRLTIREAREGGDG